MTSDTDLNTLDIFKKDSFGFIYTFLLKKVILRTLENKKEIFTQKALLNLIEHTFLPYMKYIWERIIILELNFSEQDNLIPGNNDEDRFNYFVEHFANEDNLEIIYRKYSSLQYIWLEILTTNTESLTLLIKRLWLDIRLILNFHNIERDVKIFDIKPMGDPHRGMQRTTKITIKVLDNNKIFDFYYKPKDLEIDVQYYKFIQWWNKKFHIKHKSPKVINRKNYGWAYAIKHEECYSENEIKDYYIKYGSLVALSYIFSSTDLHMENIVASNIYPTLIDIETLFSCKYVNKYGKKTSYHLYDSLLLPSFSIMGEIEISPLGANGKVKTKIKIKKKPETKTTRVKMEEVTLKTKAYKNQPILNGETIDFNAYKESMLLGFQETLFFVKANKNEFFEKIKSLFKNVKIRSVVRATADYHHVLYNQYHPNNLYKNKTDNAVNKLTLNFFDEKILSSEILQLKKGDVPFFESTIKDHYLIDGQNNKLDNVISEPILESIDNQINKLTSAHIKKLVDDINYSFISYNIRKHKTSRYNLNKIALHNHDQSNKKSLIEFINRGVERILYSSFLENRDLQWRKIFENSSNSISANVTDNRYYDGASGILLFLHFYERYLSNKNCRNAKDNLTRTKKFKKTIELLNKQVLRNIINDRFNSLGAYSGSLAEFTVLSYIAANKQGDLLALYTPLENLLQKIAYALITTKYKKYQQLDIISGVAGTLLRLLEIHRIYQDHPISGNILMLLETAFDILVKNALTLIDKATPIGFAHGLSGISSALAAYMRYHNTYNNEAMNIIRFNTKKEKETNKNNLPNTWCNGALGVALSRHYIRPFMSKDQYKIDIHNALQQLGGTHTSLVPCHGLTGELFFIKACIKILGNNCLNYHDKISKKICDIIKKNGFILDFGLSNYEIMGLMTGLSGILYSLLDSQNVPNPLCPALYLLK